MSNLRLKLQKQKFRHDPAAGIHGDCYRTAVAVCLGLDADLVPHVYAHEDQGYAGGLEQMREFLTSIGVGIFRAHLPGAFTIKEVLQISGASPDTACIITGFGPRSVNHIAVSANGAIVCDPATGGPNEHAFAGPAKCEDGIPRWFIEVLTVQDYQRFGTYLELAKETS